MTKFYIDSAPDFVSECDDRDDGPQPTTCHRVFCSVYSQCGECKLKDGTCDACGAEPDRWISGIMFCRECAKLASE